MFANINVAAGVPARPALRLPRWEPASTAAGAENKRQLVFELESGSERLNGGLCLWLWREGWGVSLKPPGDTLGSVYNFRARSHAEQSWVLGPVGCARRTRSLPACLPALYILRRARVGGR